jgi:tRNA(Arg) A34 adenosine deaminase TadA
VLRLGRPVQLEFTREEQFTASTTRHPVRVSVQAGADADGTLTALSLEILADTGAYGNHACVVFHAGNEPVKMYRCPNKRVDGWAVYTHTQPSGAFRGYGLSQACFALESALDELARELHIDPAEFRRRNMIGPGDPMIALGDDQEDVEIGSYGLEQCLTLVEEALASGRGDQAPGGAGWLTGRGIATSMLDSAPPGGHRAQSRIAERAGGGYTLRVGTSEFGNGTATVHRQLAAQVLGADVADIELLQSDTDLVDHDTGAFGSTGTMVAGLATLRAAQALKDLIAVRGDGPGHALLTAEAITGGSPRTVTFNVHGFRVAVHPATGEIRILQSVHAADAGTVINPRQCRGQVEGSVAQAIGAALYEQVVLDSGGRVSTRTFRNYHLPQFGDVPHTEVLFAKTSDELGPLGAKPMSESPFNPVAPALANAVADATGHRLTRLPLTRDRVHAELHQRRRSPTVTARPTGAAATALPTDKEHQMVMTRDELMEEACRLAKESVDNGWGGPFGAVIVRDGEIVARGQNRVLLTGDPTAHAEVEAIRKAAAVLNPEAPSISAEHVNDSILQLIPRQPDSPDLVPERAKMLTGHEIYISGTPCPMCMSAIYWSRIDAVYFGNDLDATSKIGFDDAFQYEDFAKPYADRRVTVGQFRPDLADVPYQAWAQKADKHPY